MLIYSTVYHSKPGGRSIPKLLGRVSYQTRYENQEKYQMEEKMEGGKRKKHSVPETRSEVHCARHMPGMSPVAMLVGYVVMIREMKWVKLVASLHSAAAAIRPGIEEMVDRFRA